MEFKITEHIAVLGNRSTGWQAELNKISWNGNPEKYDIRVWSEGHEKMTKGITLSTEEVKALYQALGEVL